MSTASFVQEEENSIKKAPTLVRRVSDMFKADGTYSGPPSLFSQKIRHCCQNLNLFPYLLYSFENSKSHPLTKKVNLCFDILLHKIVERLIIVSSTLRQTALYGFQQKSVPSPIVEDKEPKTTTSVKDLKARFCKIEKPKPKQGSPLLIIAIYLAPIILIFQLITLCHLLIFGKYTPGFIFLISSLMCLGYISMKIMFHDTVAVRRKRQSRREKRKQD